MKPQGSRTRLDILQGEGEAWDQELSVVSGTLFLLYFVLFPELSH